MDNQLYQFIEDSIDSDFLGWEKKYDHWITLDRKVISFIQYTANINSYLPGTICTYDIHFIFWPKNITVKLHSFYGDGVDIEDMTYISEEYFIGKYSKFLILDKDTATLKDIVDTITEGLLI